MRTIADDIYMTISGGEKHYYILANNKTYDAEAYLDSQGVPSKDTHADTDSDTQTNTTTNNTTNETNINE